METKDYVLSPYVYSCLPLSSRGNFFDIHDLADYLLIYQIYFKWDCHPAPLSVPSYHGIYISCFLLKHSESWSWWQYFDEWREIIFTLPHIFYLRLSHRKASVMIKVCEFVLCIHPVYSTLHDFKKLPFPDSCLESCDPWIRKFNPLTALCKFSFVASMYGANHCNTI